MDKTIIYRWIIPIFAGLIVALLTRRYIFFIALVSSNSMCPVLKSGDRIFTRRIYNFHDIKRGDILVFYSGELNSVLIKRVIGLPDDFVEVKDDGTVFVNKKRMKEPYVELKGGIGGEFLVPEKKYLLLGDNRTYSRDSRYWAEPNISEKAIQGKAIFCVFPLHKI